MFDALVFRANVFSFMKGRDQLEVEDAEGDATL